jgi:hypothetical protein
MESKSSPLSAMVVTAVLCWVAPRWAVGFGYETWHGTTARIPLVASLLWYLYSYQRRKATKTVEQSKTPSVSISSSSADDICLLKQLNDFESVLQPPHGKAASKQLQESQVLQS